jgi:hypothetical protein
MITRENLALELSFRGEYLKKSPNNRKEKKVKGEPQII